MELRGEWILKNWVNVEKVSWLLFNIFHLAVWHKKPMTINSTQLTELFRYIRYLETKNVEFHKGTIIPNKKSILRCMEFNYFNSRYVSKLQKILGSDLNAEPDIFDNEWRRENHEYIPDFERGGYDPPYCPYYCGKDHHIGEHCETQELDENDEDDNFVRKVFQGKE